MKQHHNPHNKSHHALCIHTPILIILFLAFITLSFALDSCYYFKPNVCEGLQAMTQYNPIWDKVHILVELVGNY